MPTPSDVRDELAYGPEALGMSEAEFEALLERLIKRETERVSRRDRRRGWVRRRTTQALSRTESRRRS